FSSALPAESRPRSASPLPVQPDHAIGPIALPQRLDTSRPSQYYTNRLINCEVKYGDDRRPVGPHLRGARRPDAPRDPLAPRARRGVGHRPGLPVQDVAARRLEAPQGAPAGRPHRPDPQGPVAALPAPGRAAARGRRLGGALPQVLGREPGPARRLPPDP